VPINGGAICNVAQEATNVNATTKLFKVPHP